MKKFVLVVFALLLGLSIFAASQENSPDSTQPTPAAKLRSDLQKAIQNGHLTDDQKTSMQNAAVTLREAVEARQNGQKVDRGAVRKAFSDIKAVADSDAFQPEDRQTVQADLDAMKQRMDETRGRRRGPLHQMLSGGN